VLHNPRHPVTGARKTRITFDAIAMFSGSKKKEQAWTLMKFLVDDVAQREVAAVQRSIPGSRPPEDVVQRAIVEGRPTEADRQYAAIHFMTLNPDVAVIKFVQTANDPDYATMQPVTTHWQQISGAWQEAYDAAQREDPDERLTPEEAVGRFYADKGNAKRLKQYHPPADPQRAAYYRKLYEESGKP
jgi:ABC-type glycerol-3-phosphate transport system substrate-binding protein